MRLVINQFLPLAVLPYLLRVLHPEPFGLLMMAQAIGFYAVVLVEYGFNLTGVRAVALVRDKPEELAALIGGIALTRLLIALVLAAGLAAAVALGLLETGLSLLLVIGFTSALGSALQPLWLFQGLEQFPLMSMVQLSSRLLCMGSIFFVVKQPGDMLTAQLLMSAPFLVGSLVLVPVAHRYFRAARARPSLAATFALVGHHLKAGWNVFLSQVATTLFTSTNTLVLGTSLGPVAAGNYAIADRVIRGLAMLTTPVTEAIYPRLVATLRQDLERALAFARRVLWAGVGVLAAVGAAVALMSGVIATVMGPPSGRHEIALALAVMAFNPLAVYANNIFGTQVLLGLGHEAAFRNIVLVSGATVPCSCWLLTRWLGTAAAPVGATLGEAVILVAMLVASQRAVGHPWALRNGHRPSGQPGIDGA